MLTEKLFLVNWNKLASHLSPQNCKVLVACSGGVDSIVLAHLLYNAGFTIHLLHVNYHLRGAESKEDEAFVKTFAATLQVPIKVLDTLQDTNFHQKKASIQIAARTLRYEWFAAEAEKLAIDGKNVVTASAHHANDNAETLLMNFCRGTGIEGLTGIAEFDKNRQLIRPLLPFSKAEILNYAKTHNLVFRNDSSNAENKYTRNIFRNLIIPKIAEIFPAFETNMQDNIERLEEVNALYKEIVSAKITKAVVDKGSEKHIAIGILMKEKAAKSILWEIVKKYGFQFAQLNELVKLITDAQNGATVYSKTHRVIKNRNWLIINTLNDSTEYFISIDKNETKVEFPQGELNLAVSSNSENVNFQSTNSSIITINADKISFPLLLRKWRNGDYFYPLGMQKKKKLSRFFIDNKLSKIQKENAWVIESDKKIIWVINYRIDNRFKVEASTKQILTIRFTENSLLLDK